MKIQSLASLVVIFGGLSFFTGCGSQYPSVSGKITNNGDPVANVKVVFTPLADSESPIPGPFSTAVTDASGTYHLKTRHQKRGAVVGSHRVGFEWADANEEDVEYFRERIAREQDQEKAVKLRKKLKDLRQRLQSRPKIPRTLDVKYEVPQRGTDSANFELTDFLQ